MNLELIMVSVMLAGVVWMLAMLTRAVWAVAVAVSEFTRVFVYAAQGRIDQIDERRDR